MLAERGRDDPLGVDDRDLAVDAVAGVGVGLDPVDDRRHSRVVSNEHLGAGLVVADSEQGRDRLWRRGGDVEAADRVVAVGAAEVGLTAGSGVEAGHDAEELAVDDLTFEPELLCAAAVPDAFGFAGVEVVVRQRLDVVGASVGALERGDASGHCRHLPVGQVHLAARPVHSSVDCW